MALLLVLLSLLAVWGAGTGSSGTGSSGTGSSKPSTTTTQSSSSSVVTTSQHVTATTCVVVSSKNRRRACRTARVTRQTHCTVRLKIESGAVESRRECSGSPVKP